jgi:hypothetical protein
MKRVGEVTSAEDIGAGDYPLVYFISLPLGPGRFVSTT